MVFDHAVGGVAVVCVFLSVVLVASCFVVVCVWIGSRGACCLQKLPRGAPSSQQPPSNRPTTEKEKSIYPPTGERTSNHHLPILLLPILTWLDLVVNLSVSTKRTYSNRFHQTTREKRFQDFYQSLPPHPVIHIYSSVKAAGLFSRNAAIPWNTNKNRSIGGTSDCRQHPKEDV